MSISMLNGLSIGLFFALFLGCGGNDSGSTVQQNAGTGLEVPTIKKELIIYTYRHLPQDDSLFQRFERVMDVSIKIIQDEPEALLQRIQSDASHRTCDVLIMPEIGPVLQAKSEGLLQPFSSPRIDRFVPDKFRDRQGYWVAISKGLAAIGYAKERIKPDGLGSLAGLANKEWKSKLLMPNANDPVLHAWIAQMMAEQGEKSTREWVNTIAKNKLNTPAKNGQERLMEIARGEADIALISVGDYAQLKNPATHAELQLAEKTGIVLVQQKDQSVMPYFPSIAIPNHADRNNAVLFIEFLTSDLSQKIYPEQVFDYAVNPMVIPADFLIDEIGGFREKESHPNDWSTYYEIARQMLSESNW